MAASGEKHGMFKHGEWLSAEYRSWGAMKSRCLNPNSHAYSRYGGRGITVCDRWRDDFAAFLSDMGRRPSPQHTLDRFPDQSGNYEPGNCRWATAKEQIANQRRGRKARVQSNNKSGIPGVSYAPRQKRWKAGFMLNRTYIHLGYFKDKTDAADEILLAKSYTRIG